MVAARSRCKPSVSQLSRLTNRRQCIEHRRDAGGAFAVESAGDIAGVLGRRRSGQHGGDGADLFGKRLGPWDDGCGGGGWCIAEVERGVDLRRGGSGGLEFGAEPADQALGLFGGAGLVERDKAGEDVLVAQVCGPAIGFGHGAIDGIVMLADQRHQPAIMNVALLVGQRAACFQRLQHVIEAGQGQVVMLGQHLLAQRIERLGLGADAVFERFGDVGWEGEFVEASCVIVDRSFPTPVAPRCGGPNEMEAAAEDPQIVGAESAMTTQFLIRQYRIEERENPMLRRFGGRNEASKPFKRNPHIDLRIRQISTRSVGDLVALHQACAA